MKLSKVKVIWDDATIFSYKNDKIKKPTRMETIGYLRKDKDNFVIIEKPINKRIVDDSKHPKGKRPNFFFIPKGMIKKISVLKK